MATKRKAPRAAQKQSIAKKTKMDSPSTTKMSRARRSAPEQQTAETLLQLMTGARAEGHSMQTRTKDRDAAQRQFEAEQASMASAPKMRENCPFTPENMRKQEELKADKLIQFLQPKDMYFADTRVPGQPPVIKQAEDQLDQWRNCQIRYFQQAFHARKREIERRQERTIDMEVATTALTLVTLSQNLPSINNGGVSPYETIDDDDETISDTDTIPESLEDSNLHQRRPSNTGTISYSDIVFACDCISEPDYRCAVCLHAMVYHMNATTPGIARVVDLKRRRELESEEDTEQQSAKRSRQEEDSLSQDTSSRTFEDLVAAASAANVAMAVDDSADQSSSATVPNPSPSAISQQSDEILPIQPDLETIQKRTKQVRFAEQSQLAVVREYITEEVEEQDEQTERSQLAATQDSEIHNEESEQIESSQPAIGQEAEDHDEQNEQIESSNTAISQESEEDRPTAPTPPGELDNGEPQKEQGSDVSHEDPQGAHGLNNITSEQPESAIKHNTTSAKSAKYWRKHNPNLPDMSSLKRKRVDIIRERDRNQEQKQALHRSETSYENGPCFYKGIVHSDKEVKHLARIAYAHEENVLELQYSDNDVPDEYSFSGKRRRIERTPEYDYPVPVYGGDMSKDPWDNDYIGAITGKWKDETPHEYVQNRMTQIWNLEILRMRERHAELLETVSEEEDDQKLVEQQISAELLALIQNDEEPSFEHVNPVEYRAPVAKMREQSAESLETSEGCQTHLENQRPKTARGTKSVPLPHGKVLDSIEEGEENNNTEVVKQAPGTASGTKRIHFRIIHRR